MDIVVYQGKMNTYSLQLNNASCPNIIYTMPPWGEEKNFHKEIIFHLLVMVYTSSP